MISEISIFVALAAGLVSFFSPCVLPLVPGYVSFISGVTVPELRSGQGEKALSGRKRITIMLNSICFILGFSAVFILLGASATWIGATLTSKLGIFTKLAGLLIIFFGLFKMGLIRPFLLFRELKINVKNEKAGYAGALMLGAAFAFGWTPCIGPVLGSILTFAGTLEQVNQGVWLLVVYSLGLALPFFLTAIGIQHFFSLFDRIKNYLGLIEKASGFILVVMGLLVFTNSLAMIQAYFPFLNLFAL
jgi:cytochrome c-type biogenesis protein